MKKITVYNKEYPMRMTMGAMRRFKQETGIEVSEMTSEVSLMVVFLYCCVVSACNADDVPFDLDIDKFADGLEMDKLSDFVETMQKDAGEDSKKKKAVPPASTN